MDKHEKLVLRAAGEVLHSWSHCTGGGMTPKDISLLGHQSQRLFHFCFTAAWMQETEAQCNAT